ncbi:MAG: alkaline phosphatase family protein [Spirochaetes bacterium]|nr:alkaline phosphatase family protein [Spirochaetota bacterium]
MSFRKKILIPVLTIIIVIFTGIETAQAYIGPGAGFALVSGFSILLITIIIALLIIIFWPIRFLIKSVCGKKPEKNSNIDRIVIIGLDGMDPVLAEKYIKEKKLPNFKQLSSEGSFRKLKTTTPAISPVAWSSFITGVDPSGHSIFDFLNRDLSSYKPVLSSSKVEKPSRMLSLGKYSIPLKSGRVKMLRKGIPFWNILGKYNIFSSILRVPITFPPEKFNGTLLSGMCVPDIKGTQGTFLFYSSNGSINKETTAGIQIPLTIKSDRINTYIPGPENSVLKNGDEIKLPLEIQLNGNNEALFKTGTDTFKLKEGVYSEWKKLSFKNGLKRKISGICRFYVKKIKPDFEMYVTPINIDPEKPSIPISHPPYYSIYLSKMVGDYATLGLAEDTWALNEGIIDEDAFIDQAYKFHEEREQILFNALDKTPKGLCACVFDITDRLQHMFFRCLEESHPSNKNKRVMEYKDTIENLYVNMDNMLGRILEKVDKKTMIVVISDHGFASFNRGVNLNTWLLENGYMFLKDGNRSGEWFSNVDWDRTKAYSFGLSGIYINKKGRESSGIVDEDNEYTELKKELSDKLTGLVDKEKNCTAINRMLDTENFYSGPYASEGPDLMVCYNRGYRNSWECASGSVSDSVFEDNTKHWSGDHCMDPEQVPGVFFCNKKINTDQPDIKDIAPTVLDAFGVKNPPYMQGKSLINSKQ